VQLTSWVLTATCNYKCKTPLSPTRINYEAYASKFNAPLSHVSKCAAVWSVSCRHPAVLLATDCYRASVWCILTERSIENASDIASTTHVVGQYLHFGKLTQNQFNAAGILSDGRVQLPTWCLQTLFGPSNPSSVVSAQLHRIEGHHFLCGWWSVQEDIVSPMNFK
jgi:hypothetical protein